MRKDVKVVAAVLCLLMVGLLAYVLLAPSHKKADVVDETNPAETTGSEAASTEAHESAPVAVNVSLTPTTQPAVSVAVAPETTQPTVAIGPVVPAVDSNVAVGSTPVASTDWEKTLSTGAVATSTGTHAALPSNTPISAWSAPVPTTPPSASVDTAASGVRKHKVAFGETLSSIAAQYYGTKANYTKILSANPGLNPNRLKVGTILTIPELKSSTKSDSTVGSPSSSAAEKASGTTTAGSTYAVKSGDSLQKIATRLYGSSDKWQKIYELNRSSIGSDPHRLRAGMVLKLPAAPASVH